MAGGVALTLWPGVQGLMAAMLLHGAAWSLAAHGAPAAGSARGLQMALAALVLVALGFAIEARGIEALVTVHALLALCGAVGLIPSPSQARGWRQNAPHARHHHP